jgi:hypothetical protein
VHHDPPPGDRPAKSRNRQQQTPTGASSSPLDAVRQLLEEKSKFEKWLGDLEEKRATTPPHVFDRVKGDYSARLDGVLEKLRTHTAALQDHAASLSRKLAQLVEAEQGILDSRAESELRAQVGELSESEWEKTSRKLEKDLAKILQDQALISSDLTQLRELLGSFDDATAQPADSASQAAAPTPGASNVDELAFLKSVIGTTPTGAAATKSGAAAPPGPGAAPTADPAQSRIRTPAAAAPPVSPSTPAAPSSALVEPPAAGPVLKPRTGAGEEPLSMHVTGSNPIVLRTSGVVEQPKTLKCGECGSLNYPSEWYCERCGAELTNV